MTALTWTSAEPCAPGVYWVRRGDRDPTVVRVERIDGELWRFVIGDERELAPGLFDVWAGPLTPPEAP